MNKLEAIKYLKWYDEKFAESLYLAHFKTSKPFPIEFPEAGKMKMKAKIILGKHEFQQPYQKLLNVYPRLTIERYNKQRKKLGIK